MVTLVTSSIYDYDYHRRHPHYQRHYHPYDNKIAMTTVVPAAAFSRGKQHFHQLQQNPTTVISDEESSASVSASASTSSSSDHHHQGKLRNSDDKAMVHNGTPLPQMIPDNHESFVVQYRANSGNNDTVVCNNDADTDEDIIMQLEAEEGLLLDDFLDDDEYGITSLSPYPRSCNNPASGEDSSADSYFSTNTIDDNFGHSYSYDPFEGIKGSKRSSSSSTSSPPSSISVSHDPIFQLRLRNLSESMKRSQHTRPSIYYSRHKSKYTDSLLTKSEYSCHQIDSCILSTAMMIMEATTAPR